VLTTYDGQYESVSRRPWDCSESYIEWGLKYLSTESPRVLGDYMCSSPVSAAVSARSLRGVVRSLGSAVRYGRPGPFALGFAFLNLLRVLARSAESAVRR
jgi:hypothetical protein